MGSDILSYIYIILIFFIGFNLAAKTAKKIRNNIVYLIFIEHMLFSFLFYLFAQSNSADANMYYARAVSSDSLLSTFGTGTQFVIFFTTIFAKYLLFSKLATFFLYGLFGFIGFQYLIKMLNYSKIKIIGFPMAVLVLFLPGFHFWTSAIGKDSLVFMLLMMSFFALQKLPKRFLLLLFAITFLAMIRPHIAFVILMAVVISLFIKNPLKFKASHIIGGFIALGVLVISLPYIGQFLNIEQLELNAINERTEFYTNYGANKTDNLSSYVDVSSYSLPLKMFAYLFRPLFFDAHSILQLLASFENLFLLILIFKWLKSINFKIIKWYRYLREPDKIMFVYVMLGWVILAATMYNLGLASRQKYMLLPVLFILIFKNLNIRKQIK